MATMQEVAARANVALSTVSYVLSGTRQVSEHTRQRVLSAIEELGYQPNAAARALASRRSNVIALVIPTQERGLGGTVGEFIDAAVSTAGSYGYHLVVWPFKVSAAERIVDLAKQGFADGVLVMEIGLEDSRIEALEAAGIPFTMIGRTSSLEGRPWVDVDFDTTLEQSVAHLVDLGHRHIAFLNHSELSAEQWYAPTFRAEAAFTTAMQSRGLDPLVLRCEDSPEAGRVAAGELIATCPSLTAVVTMNELATYGLVAGFQARGRSVPGDISVLSAVSSPRVAQMTNPPLAAMGAPGEALGRAAVLKLLAQLGDPVPAVENSLIPCSVLPGGSVDRPARPGLD